MNESERLRAVYRRRAILGLDARYAYWLPANLFIYQERERVLLGLLRRYGLLPLGERRILDVGCGDGAVLRDFLRYGAKPDNLTGVDLLEDRIKVARRLSPHLHFQVADARALPFADGSFDLALTFTLFSSLKDADLRKQIASEIQRVLRPGAVILWYDFWINPFNRDVQPLGMREVRRLFPGCMIEARRVTLAPPLVRSLASRSWLACELLTTVPLLRTHWLALVRVGHSA